MSYGVEIIDATPKWIEIPFISIYLVYGSRDVLIDTGVKSSSEKVIKILSGRDFEELDYVLTHIHIDHVSGLGYLHERFRGNVYLHPRAVRHVSNPSKLWGSAKEALGEFAELYGEPKAVDEMYLVPVSDGMIVPVGGELMFMYTPGHASHHISIFHKDSNGLFVGDSAGIYIEDYGYVIPTTIYPCRLDLYLSSLRRMRMLKPSILYYAHYGFSEDGWRSLDALYNTLLEWGKAARDLDNVEEFKSYIISNDEVFRGIYSRLDDYPLAKLLVDLAIKGVFEEVNRDPGVVG